MRAYFLKDGRIREVATLPDVSDEEAIKQARALFENNAAAKYDGFEVWKGARHIHREGRPFALDDAAPS
jgi:hypothetical protein